jgi:hypothetical protein
VERELFASRIALSPVLGYHMAMNDLLTAAPPRTNIVEYTVSELSQALRRSIEDGFGYVRVRGEVSGFKRRGSVRLTIFRSRPKYKAVIS